MKKVLLGLITLLSTNLLFAQSPGDTITVSSFNYSQTYGVNQWSSGIRDSVIEFPSDPNVTYEKVLMLYNMRCKGGNVSNSSNTDLGCGEWDISCNTYITDSTRADSTTASHPSHRIGNFSGTTYNYTVNPVYDLQRFVQSNTSGTTVVNETQSTVGSGTLSLDQVLSTNENSSKSQYLFTESELTAAGVVAGNLDGLMLSALNSSTANFLRVRIKHTTDTVLDASNVDHLGFTEVYFTNTNFSIGNERLQFHTPFNWDGVSNLLVEFSLSNSTQNGSLNVEGEATVDVKGLTTQNNYHINTETFAGFSVPKSNLTTINNEITVSFWSKGNQGVSGTATFILFGEDSLGQRQLNVHLPWGNSIVYFDCGHNGSNYNRIYKTATSQEVEDEWAHWAFSKSTSTGIMKIYRNGALWHSGSPRTHSINLDTLMIAHQYFGKVDEVRVWDKELTQSEIEEWHDRSIDNSHPHYSNLVAYYPLNEGSGNITTNMVDNQTSDFFEPALWNFQRGIDLDKQFTETLERPNVTFLQGNYNLSLVMDTIYDSLLVGPNAVTEYQIGDNSGTIISDEIIELNNYVYWESGYQYIYDGNTGNKIDSIPVAADGTINITDLPYYKRFPMEYEIMSFVTPYGINLDLGPNGKTWTFDLTDFTPILNGKKRMTIRRGGQWMEDMDIKFQFIVGTPPRDVLNIDQIWRVESKSYTLIESDDVFEPRDIPTASSANSFKVRAAVSGHGQEGEFIPRSHYINVNGGANDFTWQGWKECGENPIYPQGGTWIYDRAGWCPGMATDVQQFDITSFVTPGQPVNVDYGVLSATGTSNYIVSAQLVSYGSINHSLDAAVEDISGPTNKVEYSRANAICSKPSIIIKNTGSTDLTSLEIDYWVNDAPDKQTFSWTGNLKFNETEEVVVPSPAALWDDISGLDNIFHVEIRNPNGSTDEYSFNNTYQTDFTIPDVVPRNFTVFFSTNGAASESSYRLLDGGGNVLFSRANLTNNTLYRDTFDLDVGCYQLELLDTDDDGINFWANNDGNGSFMLREVGGGIVKILNPDFGRSVIYNFTIDVPLTYEEIKNKIGLKLYPNPARDHFTLEGKGVDSATIMFYNAFGQSIGLEYQTEEDKVRFNTSKLSSGVYTVLIEQDGETQTRKIIID